MNNIRIRTRMLEAGIKQWQLAKLLKMSEPSMSRLLRRELPEEKQDEIIGLINHHMAGPIEIKDDGMILRDYDGTLNDLYDIVHSLSLKLIEVEEEIKKLQAKEAV